MNDGFDYEWDIKLKNGMNVTENKLYEAMLKLGLKPEPQYRISQMTVDFAFPDDKIAVEINGIHHRTEHQQTVDKKRWFVLNNLGWKRITYQAEWVYNNPDKYAQKIKEVIADKPSSNYNPQPTYTDYIPHYKTNYNKVILKWFIIIVVVLGILFYILKSLNYNLGHFGFAMITIIVFGLIAYFKFHS